MEELETKTWETFLAKDSSLRDTDGPWPDLNDIKKSWAYRTSPVKWFLLFAVFMSMDSKAKTVSFKEKFGEDKEVYFLRGLNLRQLTLSKRHLASSRLEKTTKIIREQRKGIHRQLEDHPYIWQDTSYAVRCH